MHYVNVVLTTVSKVMARTGGVLAWGTGAILGVLVILDVTWAAFSTEAQTHPVITAIITGVAVGLIAGMVLDKRARDRDRRRFARPRGSAIIALTDAAWRAYDLVEPVLSASTDDQPLPDAFFRDELHRWRGVLLALDESKFLKQCDEYQEHLEGLTFATNRDLALTVLADDLSNFTKEKQRVEEAQWRAVEAVIKQAVEAMHDSSEIAEVSEAINDIAARAKKSRHLRDDRQP